MRWEYKVLDGEPGTTTEDQEALNWRGEDGWELVAVLDGEFTPEKGESTRWIFKRPLTLRGQMRAKVSQVRISFFTFVWKEVLKQE